MTEELRPFTIRPGVRTTLPGGSVVFLEGDEMFTLLVAQHVERDAGEPPCLCEPETGYLCGWHRRLSPSRDFEPADEG